MYSQFKVKINVPTLIVHNGQTADPLNRYAKAMKMISGKRTKTEADYEQLAAIEKEAGLYLNQQQQIILPGRLFEALIAEGAKKSKEGKPALASTFVDNDAVIEYDGGPLTVEQLVASNDHHITTGVRITGNRIMRTRPMFRNVRAEFLVSLETSLANPEQLKRWITAGMNQVGIGDWRPRYGRGEVVSFEELKQPLKKAA